jgi:hypothetical protein
MTVGQQTPSNTPPQAPVAPPNSINVDTLGIFLDGWSDLIEGMGGKANEVRVEVLKQLQSRGMPEIGLSNIIAFVGIFSSERRDYVITDTEPGARTTIYISQFGKDLYASWRTWIEPKMNWDLLKWFGIGAGVLGFFSGGIQQSGGFFGPSSLSFSFPGWILSTIGFGIFGAILLAFTGKMVKGSYTAFFYIEPNIFDAEDITAMGLAVHKSILRALDTSGIDITKLRIKERFSGGRRGEDV